MSRITPYNKTIRWKSRWFKLFTFPKIKKSCKSFGDSSTIEPGFYCMGIENLEIGSKVYIGPNATFLCTRAALRLGDGTIAGPGLTIVTGDHRIDLVDVPFSELSDEDKLPENDVPVIIEGNVWIGANVTILKGVTVGKGAVIGAGSVVTKDVPTNGIAVGVPSKVIKYRG